MWPRISLLKALEKTPIFIDGDWVESKDQDPEGDVRLIQLADVGDGEYLDKSNRFLTSNAAARLKCTFLAAGDILIARMPDPLGRACIFPGDVKRAVTVVDVCIVRVDHKQFDARWLMHCINSAEVRNQIASFATGTTRSRISRGNLGKVDISPPPLLEQRRIAAILDQADALRAKRRKALAELDGLAQSIFVEMFGDPHSNPKNWPLTRLDEVTDFYAGSSLPEGVEYSDQENGFFLLKVSDMNIPGNERFIKKCHHWLDVSGAKSSTCPPGSVIIPKRGGAIGTNKKRLVTRNSILDPNLMAITPKKLVIEYFFEWLNIFDLTTISSGSSVPQLNKQDLAPILIANPPMDLQQKFSGRIQALESLKAAHRTALTELDALFASLQHRAFRGEL